MQLCSICEHPIDGAALGDPGAAAHPVCFAERLPEDAMVALGGFLALVLAPAILLWAA